MKRIHIGRGWCGQKICPIVIIVIVIVITMIVTKRIHIYEGGVGCVGSKGGSGLGCRPHFPLSRALEPGQSRAAQPRQITT